MSKVLVDRELLQRCVDRWACCAIVETPGAEQAWLELRAVVKAAPPAEAEGVSNARLMNTLAELARRAPLRTLHTICETQHQVSTVKLERYLEPIGGTLAGYAFTLRIDFDKLSAALSAVTTERDRLREDRDSQQRVCIAEMEKGNQLRAEVEALRKDAERKGMRIKELDLLFGRYLLAMKAALIDADYRGDEEGMRWIYNSLAGPGELPPENESDAQAFFDREIKAVNVGMAEVLAWHKAERDAAMAAKEV